MGMNRRRANT